MGDKHKFENHSLGFLTQDTSYKAFKANFSSFKTEKNNKQS